MLHSSKQITLQSVLIGLAFAVGIGIRLIQLGQLPLDDNEARLALQAYRLAAGLPVTLDGEPLYLLGTTILFYLFGSSAFLARMVPALMGILLMASPVLFKKDLKPVEVVLIVWFIALEPALVVASRSVNSAIIALCLFALVIAAYSHQKMKTSGLLLGLLALSGTGFWWLVVSAALSVGIYILIRKQSLGFKQFINFLRDRSVWLIGTITAILIGGFLLLFPNGFSTFTNSIPAFFEEILRSSPVKWWLPLIALVVYSTLITIVGIWGSIRTWIGKNERVHLALFALISLILLLVLPGKNLVNLIWVSFPLVCLAAYVISTLSMPNTEEVLPSVGITILVVVIVFFLWQIFGRLNAGFLESQVFWIALGGGLAILILSALLAIFGWSIRIAKYGYAWGFLMILFLGLIMSTFYSINPTNPNRAEIWNNGVNHPDQSLFVDTIQEVSGWTRGIPVGLDIQVVGHLTPSLEWALRQQSEVKEVSAVRPGDQPSLVISSVETQPELSEQYRGQDFYLNTRVKYEDFGAEDWLRWIMMHKSEIIEQTPWILWVRSDLFPGAATNPITPQ